MYESDIKKMDLVITNSKNTQKRLKGFLGIDSQVLYPPVDISAFTFGDQDDYYLSFARLSDAKRVDLIVKAFQGLPDKKLIVIYGENDPQKNKVFALGEGYKNIEFITLPGNIGFINYISHCIATIYIPVDEDFGMSPIESMSAGKPVIGVDDGGLKETIVHGKTGILISKNFDIVELQDAINHISTHRALDMKSDCEKRAQNFSLTSFENELKKIIK